MTSVHLPPHPSLNLSKPGTGGKTRHAGRSITLRNTSHPTYTKNRCNRPDVTHSHVRPGGTSPRLHSPSRPVSLLTGGLPSSCESRSTLSTISPPLSDSESSGRWTHSSPTPLYVHWTTPSGLRQGQPLQCNLRGRPSPHTSRTPFYSLPVPLKVSTERTVTSLLSLYVSLPLPFG